MTTQTEDRIVRYELYDGATRELIAAANNSIDLAIAMEDAPHDRSLYIVSRTKDELNDPVPWDEMQPDGPEKLRPVIDLGRIP